MVEMCSSQSEQKRCLFNQSGATICDLALRVFQRLVPVIYFPAPSILALCWCWLHVFCAWHLALVACFCVGFRMVHCAFVVIDQTNYSVWFYGFLTVSRFQNCANFIFLISQDDLLVRLREDLHRPLSSLTTELSDVTDKLSVPRVPEICFMSDDSSPESMSSWLDNKFTADSASPLLRCESCKLLVHASELKPMS